MRGQLEHLIEISTLPHVNLRVLAFDGNHPVGTGSFSYMQFLHAHEIRLNDLVKIEQLTRNYDTDQEAETMQYQLAFIRLEELGFRG